MFRERNVWLANILKVLLFLTVSEGPGVCNKRISLQFYAFNWLTLWIVYSDWTHTHHITSEHCTQITLYSYMRSLLYTNAQYIKFNYNNTQWEMPALFSITRCEYVNVKRCYGKYTMIVCCWPDPSRRVQFSSDFFVCVLFCVFFGMYHNDKRCDAYVKIYRYHWRKNVHNWHHSSVKLELDIQ